MKLLLCSVLYLPVIFMSRGHLIAWVSKVAFFTSGYAWACNFVPPLCYQQPSTCIHCIQCADFNWCSFCFLLWCCRHHILMSLFVNKLMSLWVGKFIGTWSTTFLSLLLNGVFDFDLLETIVPVLLKGKWTPAIPRDMETLMASNLSFKNQNELQN